MRWPVWMYILMCDRLHISDVTHLYRASKAGFRSADTGSGCRSSSSVGGGNFSGRMRWRKDTGRVDSHCERGKGYGDKGHGMGDGGGRI